MALLLPRQARLRESPPLAEESIIFWQDGTQLVQDFLRVLPSFLAGFPLLRPPLPLLRVLTRDTIGSKNFSNLQPTRMKLTLALHRIFAVALTAKEGEWMR